MISIWMRVPFLSPFQRCFILYTFCKWQLQSNLQNWKTNLQNGLKIQDIGPGPNKSSARQNQTCLYRYFSPRKLWWSPKWRSRPTKRHSGSIFCSYVMVYTWILGRSSIEAIHVSCVAHNGAPGVSAGKQSCTNHLCRGWVGRFDFLYCRVMQIDVVATRLWGSVLAILLWFWYAFVRVLHFQWGSPWSWISHFHCCPYPRNQTKPMATNIVE